MNQKKNENRLPVGLGGSVLLQVEGIKERLKAVLVGLEPSRYIILNIPSISVLNEEMKVGSEIVVRYVFMGNVFAFRATVLGHIADPFPLTFISYPQEIESRNLRSETRVECHIPADVYIHNKRTSGVILDISFKGVRLVCETADTRKIEIDDEIFLIFPLPGIKGEQNFIGKIKNIVMDGKKASLGVQFMDLDLTLKNRLNSYLESVLERL